MNWKKALAGTALVTGAYFAAGNYFYNLAMKRGDKFFLQDHPDLPMGTSGTDEEQEARQAKTKEWVETTPQKEVSITSFDGINLYGTVFEQPEKSYGWMILVHGYMANQKAMYAFAREFHEYGFNILTIDCRGSGKSEGDYTTMGWLDRLDVKQWCEEVVKWEPKSEIVLYGISMGGATVMMASGEELPKNVKCIVEDCGYTSVHDILAVHLKQIFHAPKFPLMNAADTMARIRGGYSIQDASAKDQLKKNTRPMLFIHGTEDRFVPYEMLEEVYNATDAPKEIFEVEGAAHGMAYETDPEAYVERVMRFILQSLI